MGRALLVYRLAVRDLRHHAAQAALLVIAIAAATATLTMALSMNGVTGQPYSATRAATNGPDVVAYLTSAASGEDAGARARRTRVPADPIRSPPPPSGSTAAPPGSSPRGAARRQPLSTGRT